MGSGGGGRFSLWDVGDKWICYAELITLPIMFPMLGPLPLGET